MSELLEFGESPFASEANHHSPANQANHTVQLVGESGGESHGGDTRSSWPSFSRSSQSFCFPEEWARWVTQGCAPLPPRLLPRVHPTATSPAAVGHVPGRGRRPGVRTHVTRPTGSLHCLYALIFKAWAGRGSLCCAWGPMGLGACGGNSNLRLLLYTSAKTHFFASAGHGPFQPVAPFPSDSRGCPSALVTDPFETQTLGCCVRGSRHLVTDPIRAVARRHSERPPIDLFELRGAAISVVPTGCACTMWCEITATAATHTTNPS